MTTILIASATFVGVAAVSWALCWWLLLCDEAHQAGLLATGPASEPRASARAVAPAAGRPPLLSAWLARLQACPRCTRPCNVEHVGFEEFKYPNNQAVALLYCEECDKGFEILYVWDGGRWCREFSVTYDATSPPEDFASFKRRLADVTTVAA